MADATVSVDITVDTEAIETAMREVQDSINNAMTGVQNAARGATSSLREMSQRMMNVGEGMIDIGENLGQALALPFLAIGAAAVTAAKESKAGAAAWEEFTSLMKELHAALAPIGTVILQVANQYLPQLIGMVKQAVSWFMSLDPGIQTFLIGLGAAAVAIAPVIMFIGALTLAIGGLSTALTILGGILGAITAPIWIIIAAIVALVAIFVYLWNRSAAFRAFWINVWNQIQAAVMAVWNFIKPFIMAAINAVVTFVQAKLAQIKQFWDQHGEQILAAVRRVWNWISPFIRAAFTVLKGIFVGNFAVIKTVVESAWAVIKTVIDIALDAIMTIIMVAVDIINGDWKSAWNRIKDAAERIWKRIKSAVGNIVESLIDNMKNWGSRAVRMFADGIAGAVRWVVSAAKKVAGAVADFLGFGSPTKKGPARFSDEWAPNFMEMFTRGIETNIPTLQNVVLEAAARIAPPEPSPVPASPPVPNITLNYYGNDRDGFFRAKRELRRELRKYGL